jgi:hypothetical protein
VIFYCKLGAEERLKIQRGKYDTGSLDYFINFGSRFVRWDQRKVSSLNFSSISLILNPEGQVESQFMK